MYTPLELAKELGTREKRLAYLRQAFSKNYKSDAIASERAVMLDLYESFLLRLSKVQNESDFIETSSRINSIDRELTTLFDNARLFTATEK